MGGGVFREHGVCRQAAGIKKGAIIKPNEVLGVWGEGGPRAGNCDSLGAPGVAAPRPAKPGGASGPNSSNNVPVATHKKKKLAPWAFGKAGGLGTPTTAP